MFANVEPLALDLTLPWQEDPEQEKKFRELLKRILIALALFMLIVPWLPVFEPEYDPDEERITKTKVMMDPVIVESPPEPAIPQPEPEPKPEPKPPEVKPEPVEPAQVAEQAEKPAPAPKRDKESVMKEQGLAGLSDQLNALRGGVNVKSLQRKNVDKSDLGQVAQSTRDRFGEDIAAKRSDGIQVDDTTLQQQSAGLSAYSGVEVQATGSSADPGGSSLAFLSSQAGRRDMENIRRTFEAAKSSVYALYLQALNDHPNLSGKFIFRLIIEPDGSISELKLVTSELGMRDLEIVILDRIKTINFGAREVSPTAVEYAFSFLPS